MVPLLSTSYRFFGDTRAANTPLAKIAREHNPSMYFKSDFAMIKSGFLTTFCLNKFKCEIFYRGRLWFVAFSEPLKFCDFD